MRWHAALMRGCGFVAAATVALITIMVCVDVIGRNLGLGNIPWILEVTEYALPVATLSAAPWLMWRNAHVRLDLLGMVLSASGQRRADRLSAAVGLVVCIVFVWYGVATLLDSRNAGSIVMKALIFPEWWVFIPVPIGFALLGLECARRLIWPQGLTEASAIAGTSIKPPGSAS